MKLHDLYIVEDTDRRTFEARLKTVLAQITRKGRTYDIHYNVAAVNALHTIYTALVIER